MDHLANRLKHRHTYKPSEIDSQLLDKLETYYGEFLARTSSLRVADNFEVMQRTFDEFVHDDDIHAMK